MKLAPLFIKSWSQNPDRACLYWGGQIYTGSDLLQTLHRLMRKMVSRDFSRYQFWSFWGSNHPFGLLMPIACAALGRTWAPLSPLLRREAAINCADEMKAYLIDVDTDENWSSLWTRPGGPHQVEDVQALATAISNLCVHDAETGFALCFQTSGSSGTPKQVLLPESHILANVMTAIEEQRLTSNDRVLLLLSLSHSGGLCIQALPGLLSGALLILQSGFSIQSCVDALTNESRELMPTTTLLVPSFLRALSLSERAKQIDWSKLRYVGIGSAPLSRHMLEAFQGVPIRLLNIYGLTEAGPFLASCKLDDKTPAFMDVMPIGHVHKKFEWKQSEAGELFVRGPAARAIYSRRSNGANAPELTATFDADGWVATGDAVRSFNGLLYFTHRMDETLNVGGMKVTPSRIEAVFESMPGVRSCVVKARKHAVFGSILVAMLEIDQSILDIALVKKRELVREAKKYLSSYETPREIEFVECVPRSAIGKKLRHHL